MFHKPAPLILANGFAAEAELLLPPIAENGLNGWVLVVVVVVVVVDVDVVDADADRGAHGFGNGSVFSVPA